MGARGVAGALLLAAAAGCGRAGSYPIPEPPAPTAQSAQTPEQAAQRAAGAWLAVVDSLRYGESWERASATFRLAVTRAGWEQAVRQARAPVDPLRERRLSDARYTTSLPDAPTGEYVVVQYEARAAGGARVAETVVVTREADGEWRVAGYFIRPH
jgi:hypothetical protein